MLYRLFTLLILLLSAPAWGATYNIGPGQTYTTFAALVAAQNLTGDDTIDGGGNTFAEVWTPNGSGSSGHPITLRNATVAGIDGNGKNYLTIQQVKSSGPITLSGTNNILSYSISWYSTGSGVIITGASAAIANLSIYGAQGAGIAVAVDCAVINVIAWGNGNDIYIAAGATVTGTKNRFSQAASVGSGTYTDGGGTVWSISAPWNGFTALGPTGAYYSASFNAPGDHVPTGWTFTRNSVAWYPDDAGIYRSYSANTAGGNSIGIYFEPPDTNLCTNYNAAPDEAISNVSITAGSVTRSDEMATLALSGLGVICPQYAFSFANSSGDTQTITITGQAGSTDPASFYAFAWVTGGTATLQLTGAQGAIPMGPNTRFEQFKAENVTHANATDQLQIVVPDGVTVKWVLNQLTIATGASSPIVTAGASASRAAVSLTRSVPATFPTNNFVAFFDFTPLTRNQHYAGDNFWFTFFKDWENWYYLEGYTFSKNAAATEKTFQVQMRPMESSIRFAFRSDSSGGVTSFLNGVTSTGNATATGNVDLNGGTIYIGRLFWDTNLYINAQIRSFKVYGSSLTDAQCQELTVKYPTSTIKTISNIGSPVYQRSSSRIWALHHNGTNYDSIVYSDDYGDSWTEWTNWGSTYTPQFTLAMDASGNFYMADSGGTQLYRIDASTKAVTSVITWYHNPGTPTAFSWYGWHWAEKDNGTLFTTGYSGGVGNTYIYKSTDSGVNWTRIDKIHDDYGDNAHIHSLHCSPYNNKIYFSFGDDASTRGLGLTNDDFANVTIITDAANPGPTGLTFTSEATWTSTDSVGDLNHIKSNDDSSTTIRFTTPASNMGVSPLYYIRAAGDNELWAVANNDAADGNFGSLFRLTKAPGVASPFKMTQIYTGNEPELNGTTLYSISHNGRGVIPSDAPYIFVRAVRTGESPAGPDAHVLRISRDLHVMSGFVEGQMADTDTYTLPSGSPNINAGAVLYTYAAHPGDYYGRKIYGDGPDIGAVEFEDVSPGSWFFEFFSPPILNLCASTNAACYIQP